MFRLWYMTFFGESRAPQELAAVHSRRDTKLVIETEPTEEHHHGHGVHESPKVMLIPLVILAILSVIGGWMGWPDGLGGSNWFSHFLAPAVKSVHMSYEQATVALTTTGQVANTPNESPAGSKGLEIILAAVSTLVAVLGWFVAHLMYYKRPELPSRFADRVRGVYALVANKYWVDELYGAIIVTPVLFGARYLLNVLIDRAVIDGGTLAAGYTAQGFGAVVARIQSGNIRSYAGWLALFAGVLLLASYFGWTAHFWAR
jgi:NADH-quinone oxidoreductase subunit L